MDKYKKFAQLYQKTGNASQSYIDAGFKAKTERSVNSASSRLLKSVKIQKILASLEAPLVEKHLLDMDRLIQANMKIAFASLSKVVKIENGRVSLINEADLDNLDGISFSESSGPKGDSTSLSVKLPDRVKALQELARLTGLYDRKPEDDSNAKRTNADSILESVERLKQQK